MQWLRQSPCVVTVLSQRELTFPVCRHIQHCPLRSVHYVMYKIPWQLADFFFNPRDAWIEGSGTMLCMELQNRHKIKSITEPQKNSLKQKKNTRNKTGNQRHTSCQN